MDHNSEGTSEAAVRLRWGSADQLSLEVEQDQIAVRVAAAQKYIASGAGEMLREEIEAQIAQYERMFGMSSEEFTHRFCSDIVNRPPA